MYGNSSNSAGDNERPSPQRPPQRFILAMCLACALTPSVVMTQTTATEDEFSILVTGDTIISLPWTNTTDADFLRLVEHVRKPEVSITNLETTLGEFQSFPQKDSGGQHLMARSILASDLAWAGFDMIAFANNHTYDYGSLGVLETMRSIDQANLVLAGAGPDLQRARRATFFRAKNRTVALISVTTTFFDYGVAGRSRSDIIGRPGPNPLHVSRNGKIGKIFDYAQRFLLEQIAQFAVGMSGMRLQKMDEKDLAEILTTIEQAKESSDYVVLSVHAHDPGVWIEEFSRIAVAAGTDIFFAHGPHTVAGVELYEDRPIFYGLGNFTFQYESSEKLPADAFEHYGLDPDSPIHDYFVAEHEADGSQSFSRRPETWEGIGAVVRFKGKKLAGVSIIPLDLRFEEDLPLRGIPRIASGAVHANIIEGMSYRSGIYGTRISKESDGDLAAVIVGDAR